MLKYPVKTLAIGLLLFMEATGSLALTLGRPRAIVLLGQPLDVTVPVQTDAGDDINSLCLDADVLYGDVQQGPGRITLTPVASAGGQSAFVRIKVSQPVNEPVVEATLRAGCTQKVSRRYVFFTELPPTVAAVPALPPALALRPESTVSTPVSGGPASESRGSDAGTTPARSSPAVVRPPVRPAATPSPKPKAARPAAPVVKTAPRLQLDALDVQILRDPNLKFTDQLLTVPSDNPQMAATALALWRSLNAQPEEIMRNWQRLDVLEADVKSLRADAAKTEASLAVARQQLQEAQAERLPLAWFYALGALLIASLAGLIWMWRRQRFAEHGESEWWQGTVDGHAQHGTAATVAPVTSLSSPGELPNRTSFVDIDLDLSDSLSGILVDREAPVMETPRGVPAASPDNWAVPTKPPAPVKAPERGATFSPPTGWAVDRSFSASMVSALRTTNTEEVVDVRQQAEFFVSVGQNEQAIRVLQDRIDGPGDVNPLAYLDLMRLHRNLGRRIDFNNCREKFNRLFTARVPEFSAFDEKGKSLESYPEVLEHLSQEWSSDLILEILEGCIFRRPETDLGQPFDVEAFEDLLMLHGVVNWLQAH